MTEYQRLKKTRADAFIFDTFPVMIPAQPCPCAFFLANLASILNFVWPTLRDVIGHTPPELGDDRVTRSPASIAEVATV